MASRLPLLLILVCVLPLFPVAKKKDQSKGVFNLFAAVNLQGLICAWFCVRRKHAGPANRGEGYGRCPSVRFMPAILTEKLVPRHKSSYSVFHSVFARPSVVEEVPLSSCQNCRIALYPETVAL